MQPNLNSDLITYDLDQLETLNGLQLSYLQQGVIQNERVKTIERLASLTPQSMDQEGKDAYWQQQAYLRGQADTFKWLLDASKAATAASNPPIDSSADSAD